MARGPQIHQMVKATITLAAAALLLQLAPVTAFAGEDSASGDSRSTAPGQGFATESSTSIDGFAAGSVSRSVDGESATDGWANRSTPAISRDGWEVARMKLPEPTTITDGWAYRSTTPTSRDGWEVAAIELPQPATVTDGWAFRSDTSVNLASLDGWAYGTVNTPLSPVETAPAPPRQTSPPFAEIALAVSLALLAAAGAGFFHHRHQHHLPV